MDASERVSDREPSDGETGLYRSFKYNPPSQGRREPLPTTESSSLLARRR